MNSNIKRLFELYESGQASDEQRKIIEDWFSSFDNADPDKFSKEERIAFFKPVDKEIQHILQQSKNHNRFNNRWLMIAAMLLLTFSATIFFYKFQKKETDKPVVYSYLTAGRGIKKEFNLPDGSIVYLNSGSVIRIPSNFNDKTRQLSLSGEAYFLISHNSAKPFAISSGKLLITDLGTSFSVKAYPDEMNIRIAVESGKVKVEKNNINGSRELFAAAITHNQQLIYDEKNNTKTLSDTKIENLLAWHKNQICFVDASFEEIAKTLERWYNVTVTLDNNTGQCRRYTVSFNNEPISKVLNVFEKLAGITYQIKNRTITINLKKCI